MITAAAILFAAGWVAHALSARRQPPPRPGLSRAVHNQLRRTSAPWIQ